jgi:hypothetical protein
MKGHIRERSPGHWAIVIDVRDPATSKRKRRWHKHLLSGVERLADLGQIALLKNKTVERLVPPRRRKALAG